VQHVCPDHRLARKVCLLQYDPSAIAVEDVKELWHRADGSSYPCCVLSRYLPRAAELLPRLRRPPGT
jgi:hypothetical protein